MVNGYILKEAFCTNCGYETKSRTPERLKTIIIDREEERHDKARADYCDKRRLVIVFDNCIYDEVPVAKG